MLAVALLAVAVVGAITRPRGAPAWLIPAVAAIVAVALGATPHPGPAVRPLLAPIGFLLAAVPLAVLLDRLGFFEAVAQLLGGGERLVGGLWVLGAFVTTVLNLDAAVVLLTPLYVRIARRRGIDPVALAFQPVLLSCLASSALPVSNLTNLIAASSRHLSVGDFAGHLGPPSVVATVIGWFAYRRVFRVGPTRDHDPQPVDQRALAVGGVVVGLVLVGFVMGPQVGVPEWAVAAGADVILVVATRHVLLTDLPVGTGLIAASLGVLAAGAAPHLVLRGASNLTVARVTLLAAGGANLVNNLPALLVALPHTTAIWGLLLGVNVGPMILITGTLAALLWQASLRRLDVEITARRFAAVGAQVGLPALAAALLVLLALRPVVGG